MSDKPPQIFSRCCSGKLRSSGNVARTKAIGEFPVSRAERGGRRRGREGGVFPAPRVVVMQRALWQTAVKYRVVAEEQGRAELFLLLGLQLLRHPDEEAV